MYVRSLLHLFNDEQLRLMNGVMRLNGLQLYGFELDLMVALLFNFDCHSVTPVWQQVVVTVGLILGNDGLHSNYGSITTLSCVLSFRGQCLDSSCCGCRIDTRKS